MQNLPERPHELHVKPVDVSFSMAFGGGWTFEIVDGEKRVHVYTQRAIEEFRSIPRTMQDWTKITGDDEIGWTPGRKPDPRAQARADEIVSAWDRYCDAVQEAREQSGYAEARETVSELVFDPRV
jgi:hypothetical protein